MLKKFNYRCKLKILYYTSFVWQNCQNGYDITRGHLRGALLYTYTLSIAH